MNEILREAKMRLRAAWWCLQGKSVAYRIHMLEQDSLVYCDSSMPLLITECCLDGRGEGPRGIRGLCPGVKVYE